MKTEKPEEWTDYRWRMYMLGHALLAKAKQPLQVLNDFGPDGKIFDTIQGNQLPYEQINRGSFAIGQLHKNAVSFKDLDHIRVSQEWYDQTLAVNGNDKTKMNQIITKGTTGFWAEGEDKQGRPTTFIPACGFFFGNPLCVLKVYRNDNVLVKVNDSYAMPLIRPDEIRYYPWLYHIYYAIDRAGNITMPRGGVIVPILAPNGIAFTHKSYILGL